MVPQRIRKVMGKNEIVQVEYSGVQVEYSGVQVEYSGDEEYVRAGFDGSRINFDRIMVFWNGHFRQFVVLKGMEFV